MSDEVPSVSFGRTPRDSTVEFQDDEDFETPIQRVQSASVRNGLVTAVVENAYTMLKESGHFKGPELVQGGVDREVVKYVRAGSLWTFLHQAAFWNHDSAITWLLIHGANALAKDKDGKTPLDVARERGNDRAYDMLRVATLGSAPTMGRSPPTTQSRA